MRKCSITIMAVATSLIGTLGYLHAQTPPGVPSAPPPATTQNPADAVAGTYELDVHHSSVIARVSHRGMSYNVLRFGVKKGTMLWDPANPQSIKMNVAVDAKPYYAPIEYKFKPESENFLNVAKYPDASFLSKSVKLVGKNKAKVTGDLTLMGVTREMTIDAELVGIGTTVDGKRAIGFTGKMALNHTDFKPGGNFGRIELTLDAEFVK